MGSWRGIGYKSNTFFLQLEEFYKIGRVSITPDNITIMEMGKNKNVTLPDVWSIVVATPCCIFASPSLLNLEDPDWGLRHGSRCWIGN